MKLPAMKPWSKYSHAPDEPRTCTRCRKLYPVTLGNFGRRSDDRRRFVGHCNACARLIHQATRAKRPEHYKRLCLATATRSYHRNKAKVSARNKERMQRPEMKQRRNEALRRQRKTDPRAAMKTRIGGSLREILGTTKTASKSKTFDILRYTKEQLVAHLERQFTKGMSWEAFLAGEIHIDHIIPVVQFDFSADPLGAARKAWALPNLRPLWAKENLRKNRTVESLL
jgi:hypothetical protein